MKRVCYLMHITEQLSAVCNDGDLQLVNGDDEFQGRVEICNGGVWGTVCHDWWNDPDNRVVCRQLGYGAGESKLIVLEILDISRRKVAWWTSVYI